MPAPPEIEKAFQTTFKLIFGECNVKLDELEDYMLKWHYPPHFRKSEISGKDVIVSSDFYRKDAKFISQDEIDFGKKYEPLAIDEIKDIDSILEAIQDRVFYTGNKYFGNSSNITDSDTCTDVNYCYKSHNTSGARYVAYSSYVRFQSEYAFGSGWFLRSRYLIRCIGADNLTRGFECYISPNCSDTFFCYNCWASSHIMFSFNQRSKRYCIGNNELPKDRYFALRKKLVDESREYIEKHKDFPSLFAPPSMSAEKKKDLLAKSPKKKQEKEDLHPINEAFHSASKVIFDQEIGSIEENEKLLSERPTIPEKITTFFGNEGYYPPVFFYVMIPKDRMTIKDEEQICAELRMEIAETENLNSILSKMGEISLYRIDMAEGKVSNSIKSSLLYQGINALYVCDLTLGKNCGYCTYGLSDEAVFGCFRTIHSKFTIRCESCYNVTACFEMDGCSNCSNSMFCHNCENLDYCMFCFNAKSKRYAIGNVEVGREQYMKIRKIVIDSLVKQITEKKKLDFDIYNLRGK
ncbi:MAG: hypothetical protein WCT31_02545 [Candidatus Micrarchaeia archaeon]